MCYPQFRKLKSICLDSSLIGLLFYSLNTIWFWVLRMWMWLEQSTHQGPGTHTVSLLSPQHPLLCALAEHLVCFQTKVPPHSAWQCLVVSAFYSALFSTFYLDGSTFKSQGRGRETKTALTWLFQNIRPPQLFLNPWDPLLHPSQKCVHSLGRDGDSFEA